MDKLIVRRLGMAVFCLFGLNWAQAEAQTSDSSTVVLQGQDLGGVYENAQSQIDRAVFAYRDERYEDALNALRLAEVYRPNHPKTVLSIAQVAAMGGQSQAAFQALERYAALGLLADLENIKELDSLKEDPFFGALSIVSGRNASAVGSSEPLVRLKEKVALPESVAFEKSRDRFFLGSVHERRIVVSDRDGNTSDFVTAGAHGLWSVMGMKVDRAAGLLWVASAAMDQTLGVTPEELNKSAVFAFDLETSDLAHKVVLEEDGRHVFGDLVVHEDGTVYITDARARILYRLEKGADSLERFVVHPDFGSPQGLDISSDGKTLFLADYATGLFTIDIESRKVTRLTPAANVVPYGIDGLYVYGDDLIGIQNGTSPQRVVLLDLNMEKEQISRLTVLEMNHPEFLEPTLGQVVGDEFYYVANSGWPRFIDPATLPTAPWDDLPAPLILKVDLK